MNPTDWSVVETDDEPWLPGPIESAVLALPIRAIGTLLVAAAVALLLRRIVR